MKEHGTHQPTAQGADETELASVRTLYLCYFGLREPLVQTQVLPYLRQLVAAGAQVALLTFEPRPKKYWTTAQLAEARAQLAAEGIRWFHSTYHKRPRLPATAYDVLTGARRAARIIRREQINVIHGRSHIAAAMGALARRLGRSRAHLIFDIRGFLAEEYADAGLWPEGGHLFRLTKAAERSLLADADGFVVLTEQARRIMFAGRDTDTRGRPVEVIPCCVDLARFRAVEAVPRAEVRRALNVAGRRVAAYVGALGGFYLTDKLADFLATAHEQDAATFSLILTQSDPKLIAGLLRARGVAETDFLVRQVAPAEIPRYLKAADFALSFIKPTYSKLSSSPTKVAEYFAAGLPLVCTAGVGDVDEVLTSARIGVIVREFSRAAYLDALRAVDELRAEPDLAARCRHAARTHFDLETVGNVRYRRLYRRLGEGAAGGHVAQGRNAPLNAPTTASVSEN